MTSSRSGLTFILYGIEDQTLKQEADQWGSDFIKLMEYRKSPEYGKWKCCRCLLSPDREEAAIFIGMNKAADAYQALTNRETLEMALQRGLKEEHRRYKDEIVRFFMNMKDRVRAENLRVY
jgi:hypothetical protein